MDNQTTFVKSKKRFLPDSCKYVKQKENRGKFNNKIKVNNPETGKYIKKKSEHNYSSKYVKKKELVRTQDSSFVKTKEASITAQNQGQLLFEKTKKATFVKNISLFSACFYICTLQVIVYSDLKIISDLAFLAFLGCTLLKLMFEKTLFVFDAPTFLLIGFVIFACISSFWVQCQTSVTERTGTIIKVFLLYVGMRANIDTMKDFRILLNAMMVGVILMCVYTCMYYGIPYIFESISVGRRIGAEINQINGMGVYCAILISILTYYIAYERRYWLFIFTPLVLLILIGCGSRKGIVLSLISVFLLLIFKVNRNKKIFIILIFALVILFLVMTIDELAETNFYFYRLKEFLNIFSDDIETTGVSISTRIRMMDLGWDLFSQKPLTGHGIMQYEYFYELLYGMRRPPHSTFFQVIVSFGTIGFVLYYGIYFYVVKRILPLFKKRIHYIQLIITIIVLLLINDFGANMMIHKLAYICFGLITAYTQLAVRTDRNNDVEYIDSEVAE